MSLKVLVLDDEATMTFLLSSVLEFNHFEVKVTNRPEDALAELKKTKFDLFITDDRMEGMRGMDAIAEVREKMAMKEMKIILLTFSDLSEPEIKQLAANNAVYLKKPFLPNELVQRINDLFAK